MDRIYTYQDLKNIQTFIYGLKRKAKSLGIELILNSEEKFVFIDGDFQASGYFDGQKNKGVLGVGTNRPINNWLPVLVHESCHMDQWEQNIDLWKNSNDMPYNIFEDWLIGKRCNKEKAHKCINALRDLEIDCEKRAVKKILKYKLPICIKEYIQKANCYIFFYNRMKKTRKWCVGNLYKPEILSVIDSDWYESYNEIPKKLDAMFKKYKM